MALDYRMKQGQRLIRFCQENTLVRANPSSNNAREDSTHGHHWIVNTKIRLIIFFAAEEGEALHSQQKQQNDLFVAKANRSTSQ